MFFWVMALPKATSLNEKFLSPLTRFQALLLSSMRHQNFALDSCKRVTEIFGNKSTGVIERHYKLQYTLR